MQKGVRARTSYRLSKLYRKERKQEDKNEKVVIADKIVKRVIGLKFKHTIHDKRS